MVILRYSEEFEEELIELSGSEAVAGFIIGWRSVPPSRFIEAVKENTQILMGSFEAEVDMPEGGGEADVPTQLCVSASGVEACELYGKALASLAVERGLNAMLHPITELCIHSRHPFVNVWSFGSEVEDVGAKASAFIRGARECGVVPICRYLPGYWSTTFDPERHLGGARGNMEELIGGALRPSIESAKAGGAVLSHTLVTSFEPLLPASLSVKVVERVRMAVGEDALLITDYLDYEPVAKQWGVGRAGELALEAGADAVLVRSPGSARELIPLIKPHDRFHSRLERQRCALDAMQRREAFRDIAGRAVTEVRPCQLPLLLDAEDTLLSIATIAPGEENRSRRILECFTEEVESRHHEHITLLVNLNPGVSERRHIVVACEGTKAVVLLVYAPWRGWLLEEGMLRALTLDLYEYVGRVIVALVGNPFVLEEFPEVKNVIATFSPDEFSVRALARAVFGEVEARGKSPVPLT